MKTRAAVTVACAILLAGACLPATAQPAGEDKPPPKPSMAAVVIRMQYSPDIMQVDEHVEALVQQYLDEKGLRAPEHRPGRLFEEHQDTPRAYIRREEIERSVLAAPHIVRCGIRLTLTLTGKHKVEAGKLLDEICGRMKTAVEKEYEQRLQARRGQAKTLDGQVVQAKKRLAVLLAEEQALGLGLFDVEAIAKQAVGLQSMAQDLAISLAGKQARKKDLQAKIARLGKTAQEKLAKDPVAKELQRIVALREQQLAVAHTLHRKGVTTSAELLQKEIEVAGAKVQWMQRRQEVMGNQADGFLAKLNVELETLGTDVVEILAKQEAVDKRLDLLKAQRDKARRHASMFQLRISQAEQSFKELTAIRARLTTTIDRAVPIVITIEKPGKRKAGGGRRQ